MIQKYNIGYLYVRLRFGLMNLLILILIRFGWGKSLKSAFETGFSLQNINFKLCQCVVNS